MFLILVSTEDSIVIAIQMVPISLYTEDRSVYNSNTKWKTRHYIM